MWKVSKQKGRRTQHSIEVPIVAFIALVLSVAGLTLMLWSASRGRATRLNVKNPGEFNVLLPSIVGLTQGSLDPGNSVELLQNGDGFFPRLLADIAAAKESVHVESYIWWEGEICSQIANALAAKARQGVEVRLMVDASGGHKMDDKLEKLMEDAGVRLARFHPIRFSNVGKLNNRDHRKIMIIDGRIGYIGGYGFAQEWTGTGQDKDHWRDTGLRITGPVVGRLQSAFCENWVEETGEIPAGDKYFPKLTATGSTPAHVAYTSPTGGISSVQVLYYLAIKAARKEIIIQNPYMLPDEDAIEALGEAVKRGVDVKVMVPATTSTDSPIVQHASHAKYGELLKRGVKIWEYKKTLLHQKIIVVDGVWSSIGSTNFDRRALEINDEISMGVLDTAIAQQLRGAWDEDLKHCSRATFESWHSRGLWHRFIDRLAFLGSSQL